MPANAGQNRFNLGRDVTIVVLDQNGAPITISNIIHWDAKQVSADVKVDRLDSVQMNASLPKGWTCTLEAARGDSNLDLFAAAIEQDWYNSGVYNTSAVYEYITETSGATTTWKYTNASFKFEDAGTWEGDKEVRIRATFTADRRISV